MMITQKTFDKGPLANVLKAACWTTNWTKNGSIRSSTDTCYIVQCLRWSTCILPLRDAFLILWYSRQLRAIFTESGGRYNKKKSKIWFLFFESAFKMMSRSKDIK